MQIRIGKKFLSFVLAISMAMVAPPGVQVRAEPGKGGEENNTIRSFHTISTDITSQTVPIGTREEDLNLPETLQAIVSLVKEREQMEASPNNASEESVTVTVPVEWQCVRLYDGNVVGKYTFVPKLPDEYVLESGVSLPEIKVIVTESQNIFFEIGGEEDKESVLNLSAGVPCTREDLLKEVRAKDEKDKPVAVKVKDIGGMDLGNPQPLNGTQASPEAYTIIYEAIHPVTGKSYTMERKIYVTPAPEKIMPLQSDPDKGIFDISEGRVIIEPDAAGTSDLLVTYGASKKVVCSALAPITIIGTWNGTIKAPESVIQVKSKSTQLILDNVTIDVSSTDYVGALELQNGAIVNLTLSGNSELKSGKRRAGIQLGTDCSLEINGTDTTELDVVGGSDGAGIGAGSIPVFKFKEDGSPVERSSYLGNITINGGLIRAIGKGEGAGIGGNRNAKGGIITINDGIIHASTQSSKISKGAAIGSGGSLSGCDGITINGGTITARQDLAGNNSYAAAIGSGSSSTCGFIWINGGTINAIGGSSSRSSGEFSSGAGIGGGSYSQCREIRINGGTINASGGVGKGGKDSSGIGSGSPGSKCFSILISGGRVTAVGGGTGASGIGSGSGAVNYCGRIAISGGTVIAEGGSDSITADIGKGKEGSTVLVEITGGSVKPVKTLINPAPINHVGATVYMNTLKVGRASELITNCIISDYTYSIKDVMSDAARSRDFRLHHS